MNLHLVIILQAIHLFRGERSINGIIHLLKGKRSAQTIQDGYLFKALALFGVLSKWNQEELIQASKKLEASKCIVEIRLGHFQITDKGMEVVNRYTSQFPYLKKINGYRYRDISKVFWLRSLQIVQTISYTSQEIYNFIPITQDRKTLEWVKRIFPKTLEERKQWAKQLYREYESFVTTLSKTEAIIFVYKLSGYKNIGLTNEQIAEMVNVSKVEVDFMLTSVVHQLLTELKNNYNSYPILERMAKDLFYETNVTQSAKSTLKLYKKGYSLQEISIQRGLRIGTIEDHIIEMVIEDPNQSIEAFVSAELEREIISVAKFVGTTRLRPIKNKLGDQVSYFQIRLVLTKLGGLHDVST